MDICLFFAFKCEMYDRDFSYNILKISHSFISLLKTEKQKTENESNQALKHHSNDKRSKNDQSGKTNQCTRTTHTRKDSKEKR